MTDNLASHTSPNSSSVPDTEEQLQALQSAYHQLQEQLKEAEYERDDLHRERERYIARNREAEQRLEKVQAELTYFHRLLGGSTPDPESAEETPSVPPVSELLARISENMDQVIRNGRGGIGETAWQQQIADIKLLDQLAQALEIDEYF